MAGALGGAMTVKPERIFDGEVGSGIVMTPCLAAT
jgi:hypothetical protein